MNIMVIYILNVYSPRAGGGQIFFLNINLLSICIPPASLTVKYRSRSAGQGVCLKGMSRTVTMQGFTLEAITDAEKTKL